ncbi:ATP-binding protein [Sphingomonas sp. M1-B02]|uniref:ATP-binding protein n=1 Tax=Sphingomonas sp. M1-B02 TaxID=3114300 RepID=UPI002240B5E9|nr:ATP-binding protein [Sphingomonas sp. S6-11]UZK67065.1 PAS domain-containing protein [Sphingomonas sp. S6-11]
MAFDHLRSLRLRALAVKRPEASVAATWNEEYLQKKLASLTYVHFETELCTKQSFRTCDGYFVLRTVAMNISHKQLRAEQEINAFKEALGPFVVAAETARMAFVFTNALEIGHPIIFANDSFLNLVGYKRYEVIGEPFDFLMKATSDPDARAAVRDRFVQSLDTLDVEFRRADGCLLWLALSFNPVHDQRGDVVQHCVSFVDLSAQMKRMRRERMALHILYEHTPGFIALTEGPDHRFTFANAAYHRLVGARDLIGRPVEEVFPELKGQEIFMQLDAVYRTGESFSGAAMPIRLLREPGAEPETRYLDFICQPVRELDGQIAGMFWEGHDVTEQMRGAEQIEVLQAKLIHLARVSAMGTMAGTLAHELMQPLAAISNYASACDQRNRLEGGSEKLSQDLVEIGESARRGGEIIRRLRDMTMRRRARREQFDLKQAVRESLRLVRAGTGAGITIEDRSRPHIILEADRIQVQQVLMNLIRNACEAVAAFSGRVRVTTCVREGEVIISVTDSGKGVSPKASKTLFTWAESSKPRGMGMGLSICRTIVEAHGGKLWLGDSRGEGARFSFSLPVHASSGRATRQGREALVEGPPRSAADPMSGGAILRKRSAA